MLRSFLHSNNHGSQKILYLRVLLCPISAQERISYLCTEYIVKGQRHNSTNGGNKVEHNSATAQWLQVYKLQ